MVLEVILPKVDMDMSSAVISRWHVKDGDTVKKGQAIFDIETDKAAMEIEAPGDGAIKLVDLAGVREIAIGTIVAMIFGADEEVSTFSVSALTTTNPTPLTAPTAASPIVAQPLLASVDKGGVARATPLARKLARQAGVDLKHVAGSGPSGRVVAADISARGPVAKSLAMTGQNATHFHLSATCNVSSLIALIQRLNAHAPKTKEKRPSWQLSFTDIAVKALATALLQVPAAAVILSTTAVVRHEHVGVAVAVFHSTGVATPIVSKADSKSLAAIATEMQAFAERAASGNLQASAGEGGSAGICDLGAFGVEQISGFIDMPQAVVLAIGAAVERFTLVAGQPVLAKHIKITLICDHRAIGLSAGARLLAATKRMIEEPALMLL